VQSDDAMSRKAKADIVQKLPSSDAASTGDEMRGETTAAA
jgi:hypothetical protein